MWTVAARAHCAAIHGNYPSSMNDEEWALIAPHFPIPKARSEFGMMLGKDMTWPMRRIVDAIFYVLRNGWSW